MAQMGIFKDAIFVIPTIELVRLPPCSNLQCLNDIECI